MNEPMIRCLVSAMTDEDAIWNLATLNRLSGTEVPERRAMLIENLLATYNVDELSKLLPDDRRSINELAQLASLSITDLRTATDDTVPDTSSVILSFVLPESEAKEVDLSIDLMLHANDSELSRSHALVQVVRAYLAQRVDPTTPRAA